MGFNCGIVGLPNVGKSTIFNALTAAGAEAANYPFCTIEPNTGVVPVPDARLAELAAIANSQKVIPTSVEFVDIAGLVKGAHEGEGLGNQFLGHIRSVDAVVHVVRCFDDENITHVDGSVAPERDIDVIETELLLADLASVERRLQRVSRAAKSGDKALKAEVESLELAKGFLEEGVALRGASISEEQQEAIAELGLITSKPMFFVANVDEANVGAANDPSSNEYVSALLKAAQLRDSEVVIISGKVESEISQLDSEEREAFLEELGLESSGLDRLAMQGYKTLDLITFFTCGPKETRAWTCPRNTLAPDAAGVIHTDFCTGFIRAEVISFEDYIRSKGEQGAKEAGLMRLEGKAYPMKDGDVVHFRFNV